MGTGTLEDSGASPHLLGALSPRRLSALAPPPEPAHAEPRPTDYAPGIAAAPAPEPRCLTPSIPRDSLPVDCASRPAGRRSRDPTGGPSRPCHSVARSSDLNTIVP